MIDDILYPDILPGHVLDQYLGDGWYRLGNLLFTSHIMEIDGKQCRLYWIRYNLTNLQWANLKKNALAIVKRNRHFSVQLKKFELTDELENLYALYQPGTSFNSSATINEYLDHKFSTGIFDTHVFEVRDGDQLIAAGIFDYGKESMAGIMNFYDPRYRKYSPGKFLIMLKIRHAMDRGIKYFYPGYIAYGNPMFDYKTFASDDSIEFYAPQAYCWFPYDLSLLRLIENGEIILAPPDERM